MNQEKWNTLTTKLTESEDVQARIEQLQSTLSELRIDINELSDALQQELAELRTTTTPAEPTTDEPSA